jgi:cytochrome c553
MEHTKHIIRAVLLLVLIAVVFVVVRHFAIPGSFGMYGHYRFASVAEYAAPAPVHGTSAMCIECHDEEGEVWSAGVHHTVPCEVCHAPLTTHVRDGEKVADMPVRRSYKLCARCHQKLAARPKDFPQVVLQDHVGEQGFELTDTVCWECHEDAHNPGE